MSKLFDMESVPAFRVATPNGLVSAQKDVSPSLFRRRNVRRIRRDNRAI